VLEHAVKSYTRYWTLETLRWMLLMTRCILVAQVLVVAVVLLDYHLHFAMTLRFLVLTVCCPRSLLLTSGLARAHLYSQLFRALQVLGQ